MRAQSVRVITGVPMATAAAIAALVFDIVGHRPLCTPAAGRRRGATVPNPLEDLEDLATAATT
jgi:hypothetical protein